MAHPNYDLVVAALAQKDAGKVSFEQTDAFHNLSEEKRLELLARAIAECTPVA